ncbi:hypothetical protein [Roseibacillus persicicus]|uniref:Lipocalin-like domain-containing protein n=1 Tax=Roseibacillus persicicus TaxID=454148 RepID=A0A918TZK3_9BACT|nr:hypothetical protein [Roseibacillus persicicus]GHC68162.1 hypothetical protein GCM10007100_40280 [Roseibacillus persicicus]
MSRKIWQVYLLSILVTASCEKTSSVPEPYSLIVGEWSLVSTKKMGEIRMDDGREFTPDPPQAFVTSFPSDAAILDFQGFGGIGGVSQLSLNIHPEQPGTIVGNNGLYYCSFNTKAMPPEMNLRVFPNGWQSESLLELATYELTKASGD